MRLFFALWPGDEVRAQVAAVAASIAARSQGRAVPAAKLHLTLSFLGEIAEDRVADALEAAHSVRGEPFELTLDATGSFRAARVAWAAPSKPPAALVALQASLDRELRSRGFVLDERPFAAHATLARKIATVLPRDSIAPIAWSAREFVLVGSETGRGSYAVLERWELRK
ncbi:MAG TPA: RNA 2',3'-cyclic phosphodiesterase [Usitatibacter sp.]